MNQYNETKTTLENSIIDLQGKQLEMIAKINLVSQLPDGEEINLNYLDSKFPIQVDRSIREALLLTLNKELSRMNRLEDSLLHSLSLVNYSIKMESK